MSPATLSWLGLAVVAPRVSKQPACHTMHALQSYLGDAVASTGSGTWSTADDQYARTQILDLPPRPHWGCSAVAETECSALSQRPALCSDVLCDAVQV